MRIATRAIELLAPAKDLNCGVEAIHHGADAVYIGAPPVSVPVQQQAIQLKRSESCVNLPICMEPKCMWLSIRS